MLPDLPHRGVQPRVLLLDHLNADGEPRAVVVFPRKQPIVFASLTKAVAALKLETRA